MSQPNLSLNAKQKEQIRTEGKARLMWGDSPEKVEQWLREQGLGSAEIATLLAEGARERAEAVRGAGMDDLLVGFLFMLIFGGVFLFLFFSRLRFALIDFSGLLGSGYGLYLMLRGVYRILEGGSYSGSISELSKDD